MSAAIVLLAFTVSGVGPIVAKDCRYDRASLLALDQQRFDQEMDGGWRSLQARGCYVEAADLIAVWREAHQSDDSLLYWHEGQMRAFAGQTRSAIMLFGHPRKTPATDNGWGWNLYVDGTIAFLKRDIAGLRVARETPAVLPKPPDFPPPMPTGVAVRITWPVNLWVLDSLLRCWSKPYGTAYSC